ncbi:DUF2182 domain-containing protein [Halomonas icarae]|nr:DUF2182 domain-containing protein [Halomonas icarae]MDR5902164.1 DUF2182 domain-containing protein [Halomonas icarae]
MSAMFLQTLRHDRTLLAGCLALAVILSWWYLMRMAGGMPGMDAPMPFQPWATFTMWMVMMVGMMLPGATPGILMFAAARPHRTTGASLPYLFALGYLLAWVGYSVLATMTQWALHSLGLLTPDQAINATVPSGLLLMAAGAFQWTPLKHVCLHRCRSPMGIVLEGFPSHRARALRAGIRLGLYCTGCCWALMALMFVGGVMSLTWMALLTLIFLLEKMVPAWKRLSDGLGMALLVYGAWVLLVGIGLTP